LFFLHSLGITTQKPGATGTPPVTGLAGRTCNFEQASICGYTQDRTDNFDWTRDNGGTGTAGTGPTKDHTYNTAQGQ